MMIWPRLTIPSQKSLKNGQIQRATKENIRGNNKSQRQQQQQQKQQQTAATEQLNNDYQSSQFHSAGNGGNIRV